MSSVPCAKLLSIACGALEANPPGSTNKWPYAFYEHCRSNWAAKLQSPGFVPANPSGYSHLRRFAQEIHQSLMFFDDCAPSGFFVVCRRC